MNVFQRRAPGVRNRAFFVSDLLLLPLCATAAFSARYEGLWSPDVRQLLVAFIFAAIPLKLVLLLLSGMYRRLWRYASVADLEVLMLAAAGCGVVDLVAGSSLVTLGFATTRPSAAAILLDVCLGALVIALPRLLVRMSARRDGGARSANPRRVIIVGAGVAGGLIVRELLDNARLDMLPVALLDDDPRKHHLRLNNVPVVGSVDKLEAVAEQLKAVEVIVAMPSAPGGIVRRIVRQASAAGLATRTVPGLYELLSGEKRVDALRRIEIQDLLRREPINTDIAQVASLVTGRVVVVTGAGGSIGSELCRQMARLKPERIVAVGRGENSIFDLVQEFARTFPEVAIQPVIADVRDRARMESIISVHRPFSFFHAAAHKHVPLMEANVAEAVMNNVLGTQNVVTLCAQYDVEHFVLISTDKAVRPTSVMGATKRIAEHLVHDCGLARQGGYVSVRFGNVLGSRGSVVPTFMRQIAQGGPVTITHPDMTRYFMTIPEAVQLVLQAAALGQQGEVFVLDMGEPVRVADLAMDLIRLSGLEPNTDIEVEFTGVRPGEKLYEELFFQGAHVSPTIHPKILRARDAEADGHDAGDIEGLIAAARANMSSGELRRLIVKLVPEYSGRLDTGEYPRVLGDAADALEEGLDELQPSAEPSAEAFVGEAEQILGVVASAK